MKSLAALLLAGALIASGAVAAEDPVAYLTVERGSVAVRRGAVTTPVNVRSNLKVGDRLTAGEKSFARIKYRDDCRRAETIKDGQIRVIRRELHCVALIPGGVGLAALVALAAGDQKVGSNNQGNQGGLGGQGPVSP